MQKGWVRSMARADNVLRLHSQEHIDRFIKLVEGQTFYNFHVEVCPIGGEFQIDVISNREKTSHRELQGALMSFLAFNLIKG